jgi:hypothetical protein
VTSVTQSVTRCDQVGFRALGGPLVASGGLVLLGMITEHSLGPKGGVGAG